jgi:hypothetical protein
VLQASGACLRPKVAPGGLDGLQGGVVVHA